jgi:hypothetical protein
VRRGGEQQAAHAALAGEITDLAATLRAQKAAPGQLVLVAACGRVLALVTWEEGVLDCGHALNERVSLDHAHNPYTH